MRVGFFAEPSKSLRRLAGSMPARNASSFFDHSASALRSSKWLIRSLIDKRMAVSEATDLVISGSLVTLSSKSWWLVKSFSNQRILNGTQTVIVRQAKCFSAVRSFSSALIGLQALGGFMRRFRFLCPESKDELEKAIPAKRNTRDPPRSRVFQPRRITKRQALWWLVELPPDHEQEVSLGV